MLTKNDEIFLKNKDISTQQIEEQLKSITNGFPYLEIKSAAEVGAGILKLNETEMVAALNEWEFFLEQKNSSIIKFVPASGAASRMFKDLFEFLDAEKDEPLNKFMAKFFSEIEEFAFYDDLNKACILNENKSIHELLKNKQHKTIVKNLLSEAGLNYGSLPKGLLKFHKYNEGNRTPMQEHLVEGALYAKNSSNNVNIHFTVSKEHRSLFKKHLQESIEWFEKNFRVNFEISFSEQKPSTDTIAADEYNQPFRDNNELIFRPGGHGALIENLNDLTGDVIFIKNIDNVVPDSLKLETVIFKKILAGWLIKVQQQCFDYLKLLNNEKITELQLHEIAKFCETELNNKHNELTSLSANELKNYLISKLNRPIRVCGMVKNEGEPGGGPFLTKNTDGTVSLQILESSQINISNPKEKELMQQSTHFNPVDLVCTIKDYKGNKFNLLNYVDKNTGFISFKSKNGKELKALELPGLWNGAMSDWNTIFIEVPASTFNPVKTVNDLLRTEHQ